MLAPDAWVPLAEVIVDVASGNQGQVEALGELGQPLNAAGVTLDQVVLDLDEHVSRAEQAGEVPCGLLRLRVALVVDEAGDF